MRSRHDSTGDRRWHHRSVVPQPRQAVRVLLIDEADRVLLMRIRDDGTNWWWTPGGGVEPGETDEQAAYREIAEETGLTNFALGPCVWKRRHTGTVGGRPFDQQERIYLARVRHFTPHPGSDGPPEHATTDMRWWSVAELEETADRFTPTDLAAHLRALLAVGPPAVPVEVGP
jgi:8-oxo-dGTP pyrophosphatase MutT (NUDIX family)